jgi:hypothetical protein
MEELAPVLVTLAMFFGVGWIVRMTQQHRRQLKLAQMHVDLQTRLVERFANSQELLEYLRTDAARNLVETAPAEPASPYSRILASIQTGLVLLLGGGAMLVLSGMVSEAAEGLTVFGVIGFALGLGFLISAAVSYWLSRTWGLVEPRRQEP